MHNKMKRPSHNQSDIAHTSKILTKIILDRIKNKIEQELIGNQYGFRKGRGTRETIILGLTLVIENINKSLHFLHTARKNVR